MARPSSRSRALPAPGRRARLNAGDRRVLVLHGPNLNLLGTRELEVYGSTTLAEIDAALHERARGYGLTLAIHQSNHEGVLVDLLHDARTSAQGVIINAGGYTHTSVVLRDTLRAIDLPAIEVHLSNTLARESFRHASLLGGACVGRIEGFGAASYALALDAMAGLLSAARSDD